MAPDDQPPTATPSLGEYAQQGLTVSLDILAAFADKLPFPAAPIFTLAKSVLTNVETIQGNTEECGVLKDHIGQLLPVVLAAMEEESKRGTELEVPAQLQQNVARFHTTLQKIDDTVREIKEKIDSKRKRDRIITFAMSKWYTSKLKKCRDDLNWAMELFKVTDQFATSVRICNVSRQIEGVAGQVAAVGTDVRAVGGKVETVASRVEGVSSQVGVVEMEVKSVAGEVHTVSGQVEGVSSQVGVVGGKVEGVSVQVGDVSTQVADVSGQVEVVGSEVAIVGERVEGVSGQVGEVSRKVEGVSSQVAAVRTNAILEAIPRSKRASSTSARHDSLGGCFEGTRTAILDLIFKWMVDLDPRLPKCFWLKGLAGIGKSTIAYSIAKLARSRGLLVVDFFFSRLGDKELRDPTLVIPTIAYQLALLDPEFSRVITAALETHPDAGYSSLKNQLDQLIIEPLSKVQPDRKRIVVLVFDAFDECEAKGAKEILQLLVAALPFLPFFLKIFITSRPEEHIRSVLVPSNNLHITALHDIEDSIVKEDIETYLRARLRALPKELGRDDLDEDWITEEQIKLLAEAAGTLFIHAATALRFLMDILGPRKQLKLLLKFIQSPRQAHEAQPFASLDELYLQILRGIISRTMGGAVAQLFRTVVGSIVLLRDPLPVRALERFTDLDEDDATELLKNLHSIILPPGPPDYCPRSYHPSFPDFLLDHARCSDDKLWIDANIHEARIALRCLEVMNKSLHKNMLGPFESCLFNHEVPDLAEKIKAAFTPELLYACRHWASHLAAVPHPADARIIEALAAFCSRFLMPWLESVSWIGQTRSAIPSLEAANAWAATSMCSSTTISLLNDAHRLLLAHFPTITQSAPHIARSVLPFTPENIQLASTYANYADPNVRVIEGADQRWTACLMTLKGHTDWVTSVAVSPDGTCIASGSGDNTLRIWNANSGDLITVLKGRIEPITSVAFSPDGERIVSGSYDETVRLWDVTTGREVSKFKGHSGSVRTVSFSPDGGWIASGSEDLTIRICDAVSGGVLRTLKGHSGSVQSVVFFPDGRRLTSGSYDHTVRVWNLEDGNCVATLEGHSDYVYSVAISPDGLHIASGSTDKTLRIWDVSTVTCIRTLHGHTGGVQAVAFSPNGRRIVSGSGDKSVRLWDATTYDNIMTYSGHADGVTSAVFSHDGRHIVSGSEDQSIKVWDASVVQRIVGDDSSENPGGIVSLAFSSDESRIAILMARPTPEKYWHFELSVHVRDSAMPMIGSDLISFRSTELDDSWTSRVRFAAGDTQIIVTSNRGTFVYDASDGPRLVEPVDGDSEHQEQSLFTLEDGKILRHDTSPSSITCILPSSLQANDILSSELGGGAGDRILVGCRDGRIVTLHIT